MPTTTRRTPWLGPVEGAGPRRARGSGVPTLGICLGHQLVAVALGGGVERNPRGQQVGLLDVGWTGRRRRRPAAGGRSPRRGAASSGTTTSSPRCPRTRPLLAETADGEVQAARFAPAMWGVQLHPEVDADVLVPWAEEDRGSHETRGIDPTACCGEIDAARAELDEAWRPLADGLRRLGRVRG